MREVECKLVLLTWLCTARYQRRCVFWLCFVKQVTMGW